MLSVGSFPTRDCQGMTRRTFVQAASALPFAWQLAGQPAAASTAARARSVLLIWLGGGPSHLDLFDPKPRAPVEFRGPFSTIATRSAGVRFTELLPKLAACSNHFSLIRTNINYNGGHRPAGSIALTGSTAPDGGEDTGGAPGRYPPHFGSILARHRGAGQLPSFVSLARGPIGDGVGPVFGFGGGAWGRNYDPFMMQCAEDGRVDLPELRLLDGLTPARLADRRMLLQELSRLDRLAERSHVRQWRDLHERAFGLLASPAARRAFDLSQEPARLREAYGQSSFGQSCLLGRRLVEAGVPFVQVNWSQYVEVFYPFSDYGWDTHADNFGLLADWHGPLLDHVMATLLDDLDVRGLLRTTLVVCMGEFGRTPRINSIGSRDHWHPCYFSLWAGGGVQPGRVIGESDARGEHPATEPITPAMVGATILDLAGVSSAARAQFNVLERGRVIDGLL
ncbi:MAG: DUF1501 domain-containing protein [Planctomycetes bacterium]|nr:DUF1501 domain-containing protein [Planctomycetota bacterium]